MLVLALLGGTSVQSGGPKDFKPVDGITYLKKDSPITTLNFNTLIRGKHRLLFTDALNKKWVDLINILSKENEKGKNAKKELDKYYKDLNALALNAAEKIFDKKNIDAANRLEKERVKNGPTLSTYEYLIDTHRLHAKYEDQHKEAELKESVEFYKDLPTVQALERNLSQTEYASSWYTDEGKLPVNYRNEPTPKQK